MDYKIRLYFGEKTFVMLPSHFTPTSVILKMKEAGRSPWTFTDDDGNMHIILLNAQTAVKRFVCTPIVVEERKPEPISDEQYAEVMKEELPPMDKQEAPKESEQERQDRLLEELKVKANCLHEFDKLELGYKETANGKRYQPVCTFCGNRQRYVGIQKIKDGAYDNTPTPWTIEHVLSAKILPEI
jgi:hypothetical protein